MHIIKLIQCTDKERKVQLWDSLREISISFKKLRYSLSSFENIDSSTYFNIFQRTVHYEQEVSLLPNTYLNICDLYNGLINNEFFLKTLSNEKCIEFMDLNNVLFFIIELLEKNNPNDISLAILILHELNNRGILNEAFCYDFNLYMVKIITLFKQYHHPYWNIVIEAIVRNSCIRFLEFSYIDVLYCTELRTTEINDIFESIVENTRTVDNPDSIFSHLVKLLQDNSKYIALAYSLFSNLEAIGLVDQPFSESFEALAKQVALVLPYYGKCPQVFFDHILRIKESYAKSVDKTNESNRFWSVSGPLPFDVFSLIAKRLEIFQHDHNRTIEWTCKLLYTYSCRYQLNNIVDSQPTITSNNQRSFVPCTISPSWIILSSLDTGDPRSGKWSLSFFLKLITVAFPNIEFLIKHILSNLKSKDYSTFLRASNILGVLYEFQKSFKPSNNRQDHNIQELLPRSLREMGMLVEFVTCSDLTSAELRPYEENSDKTFTVIDLLKIILSISTNIQPAFQLFWRLLDKEIQTSNDTFITDFFEIITQFPSTEHLCEKSFELFNGILDRPLIAKDQRFLDNLFARLVSSSENFKESDDQESYFSCEFSTNLFRRIYEKKLISIESEIFKEILLAIFSRINVGLHFPNNETRLCHDLSELVLMADEEFFKVKLLTFFDENNQGEDHGSKLMRRVLVNVCIRSEERCKEVLPKFNVLVIMGVLERLSLIDKMEVEERECIEAYYRLLKLIVASEPDRNTPACLLIKASHTTLDAHIYEKIRTYLDHENSLFTYPSKLYQAFLGQ